MIESRIQMERKKRLTLEDAKGKTQSNAKSLLCFALLCVFSFAYFAFIKPGCDSNTCSNSFLFKQLEKGFFRRMEAMHFTLDYFLDRFKVMLDHAAFLEAVEH